MNQAFCDLVYTRDSWQCRHCKDRNALHPHHVIHRSQQGLDTLDNLLTLCAQCHEAYHRGDLQIDLIRKDASNPVVHFTRRNGWVPR